MGITDVTRLRGTPPGCGRSVLRAIRCAFCRAGCSLVVLVRCFSVQDAESYTWPERVLLLDSVTTVVPIGNSRSTSSRGGVVSVFARGFNVLATGGGCTDFIVYEKYRAVVCWGCLRFLFRPCLPRFAVVIFTAIFPLRYPGVDVTFR